MSIVQLIRRNQDRDFSVSDIIKKTLGSRGSFGPLHEDTWIRVSSIGTICEREEVICSLNNIHRDSITSADSEVNFAHGHAVHWMFQTKVLADIGILIGGWRCTYCGTQYGSRKTRMIPRPSRCTRCGAIAGDRHRPDGRPDTDVDDNAFIFVEEWLGNEEYKIGGSPDGQMLLDYDPNYKLEDLTLLEFKSTNETNFKKVENAPDFVHVIQGMIYLWLTGYKKLKIVYFNKNEKGTDGIREYDLDYDAECIDRVLAAVKTVRAGILDRKLPPRTVCSTFDCSRAFRCKAKNICFADDLFKETGDGLVPDKESEDGSTAK